MATEIEYKYLIRPEAVAEFYQEIADIKPELIAQGYLNTDKERTVRVRIKGDKGYLTVKGLPEGIAKPEWEYEIPVKDAHEMISLCTVSLIKERYKVPSTNGLFWEVDVFKGDNAGLILAEIEVPELNTVITVPNWIGENVSLNHRFANSYLATHPFSTWQDTASFKL